ncbi:hypothetical protein SMSP2_00323 [Limihaloglobus sulfuriphilus]|uniref:AMMECR1 domain-containing protein n=1 Tax=Limihaloglobus sulfuriphilus TaxID=1851148 RepID=A0A1Q2MBB6_9BACT|nr:AmmeMemoRadiSam system protein A [Limihaloglobus sulfuriphilus]AQQ69986.1 hypothetical protein SMSP2_00323 [Limihaloglobus sulfuriphilus]
MLTENSKRILLKAAKEAVISAVNGDKFNRIETNEPELLEKCGCFVTIKNKGRLRGCLGVFTASKPLIDMVTEMAASSATNDPRFYNDPITPEELEELDIEISVLSPLRQTDDPASLRIGQEGIYIRRGMRSGCFLPQVAEETGWSVEEFLGNCCTGKAGLDYYSWKDPDTKVYLFTVEIVKDSFK